MIDFWFCIRLCNKGDKMKKLVLMACVLVGVGFGADIKTLTQQCEAKDGEACIDLMLEYSEAKNYSKYFEFAQKACNLKNARGCRNLGHIYYFGRDIEKDFFKAREYYQQACDLKDGNGCVGLGVLYVEGKGVRLDFTKAVSYFKMACDLKDNYGCNFLGWCYKNGQGVKANKNKAKEFFGKACDLGLQDGCDNYKNEILR